MYSFRTLWNLSLYTVGLLPHIVSVKMLLNGKFHLLLWQHLKMQVIKKTQILSICSYTLHRAHERLRLANISAQHLVKEQQDTSLHTAHRRPDLEPPCVGNLNHRLPLSGDLAPRDYSVIPSSAPQTTSHRMETCLFEVSYIIFFPLGYRFPISLLFVTCSNSEGFHWITHTR